MQHNPKPVSAPAFRREVYEYLKINGITLTEDQRSGLSEILKSVLEHRVIESRKENDAPIKHEVLCPKCGDYKMKVGKQFKNWKKKLPDSVEVK